MSAINARINVRTELHLDHERGRIELHVRDSRAGNHSRNGSGCPATPSLTQGVSNRTREVCSCLSFDEAEHLATVLRDFARIVRVQHGVGFGEVA